MEELSWLSLAMSVVAMLSSAFTAWLAHRNQVIKLAHDAQIIRLEERLRYCEETHRLTQELNQRVERIENGNGHS